MPNLLGTGPSQVPTNGDLGKLAFMDVVDTVTNNPYVDTAISDTKPSLLLDFANSKTLDPRITYSRASTATYYDGKTTAVAEQNLLTYSQDFSNSIWTKGASTVSSNVTVAPDGSSTASKFIANSTNAQHKLEAVYYAVAGQQFTISLFAKAAEYSKFTIWSLAGSPRFGIDVDLVAVTVASSGNVGSGVYVSSTINSAGNGWYRVSVTGTMPTSGNFSWATLLNDGTGTTFTGDGTSGIYIWGAQLEQRSAVSSYTPTTSSPITNYIPALQTAAAGVPRFDHDPITGESKGFLIEEQRTNLTNYSSQFDDASWTNFNSTVVADTIVSPDGTLNGDKLVASATTTEHSLRKTITPSASTAYTASAYFKAGGLNYCALQITFGGLNAYQSYNLATGVLVVSGGGATGSIAYVGNGWYRCTVTATTSNTSSGNIQIRAENNGSLSNFLGDGFNGVYVWGAQLEAGAFPTSYIPTTSSQITRGSDVASMTGTNFSSWYRADEGTVYSEAQTAKVAGDASNIVTISDGTSGIGSRITQAAATQFHLYVGKNGVAQANLDSGTFYDNMFSKLCGAYKTGDFASSLAGGAVVTTSSGSIPTVDRIAFGANAIAGGILNGTIKKFAYYPKRLADAELQEMTQ